VEKKGDVQIYKSEIPQDREWNVHSLKRIAKDYSLKDELQHCGITEVEVYRDESAFSAERAMMGVGDPVPAGTTPANPLIAVAPNPKKQPSGDPGYPFNDSIYILYSKPDENEIAVIATAFAATKTVALTARHTISSKNNKSDKILLINENLFLTTVLVRNDSVIAPEEGKVEIPVTVKKFHYENNWAVLERSDGNVFPQTIPVATSVTDIPRDGASEPMTFYYVPYALFRDDTEYTDRLHVTPKQGPVGLVKKNYIDFQNGGFVGSCGVP
jgi:hypothetical protein